MFRLRNKLLFNVNSECEILKNLYLNLILHKSTCVVQDKPKLTNIINKHPYDAMDVYTNNIISENIKKWKTNNLSTLNKKLSKIKSNSVFKFCDDPDHLIKYLQNCLDGNCNVSQSVLTQFMFTMTKHGRINGLILIEKINAKYDFCINKSDLKMNFAKAHWINGNLNCMFTIFEKFYPLQAMQVNYILESIIYTIVKSRGVASIVVVTQFANSIAVKHGDHYPMSILWKYLFLSELYNDNLEAEKLLRQNNNLIEYIQHLVPIITKNVLKNHNTSYVQKLMVILLRHNRMEIYQWTLRSLFEYYCK